MSNYAKKSSYGSSSSSSSSKGSSSQGEGQKTTHYAYTLQKDKEGNLVKDENGRAVKDFVNDILIFENEFTTRDGVTFSNLKVIPTADLPAGTEMFVVKKKAK